MSSSQPPDARQFRIELDIDAPAEAVWRAISTAEGFSSWFAPEAEVTAGPEGQITWRWNEFFQWSQEVDLWEPGKRLRTRYPSAVDDGAGGKLPLFLDFTLEGRGEGRTRLRLVHSGFGPGADFDEEYEGISQGWPVELRSLRLYLESHAGQPRRITWSTAPVALSSTEAWAKLMGPDGLDLGERYAGASEGDPFRLETDELGLLEGTILTATPQQVAARVTSHGDAFLRLSADNCGGTVHVWLWLATYGDSRADLTGLQSAWDRMLQRLFPERVELSAPAPAGAQG